MVAELVAGAFLSAFLEVLFERLASSHLINFFHKKQLDENLLKRLEISLWGVNAVLNDAEQRQVKDPSIKGWLNQLKDAIYEADDLLDEIETKARNKKEVQSSSILGFKSLGHKKLRAKVEEIIGRIEFIARQKDVLGLKEILGEKFLERVPSTSLVEGADVYGRVKDKEAIINFLLLDDVMDSSNKLSVLPIVGMGGIGKTTLAQVVFNDDKMRENFDLNVWVCVSAEFDVTKITKTIIEAVTLRVCDIVDFNLLQLQLKDCLTGKRFLLILDDVWNENYGDWEILQKPFHYGAGKIIITTRSEKVASVVQTVPAHHVGQLSDDDCWFLFAKHAFRCEDSYLMPSVEDISKEIIKKCGGLPLAVKTLASLLRLKPDIKDWDNILKSEIWDLPEGVNSVIPALKLSYHHLPQNLKQCFAYCSIFPKNYSFEKEELVLLWMAENFLQLPRGNKKPEDVGFEYFDELVSRSFLQCSSVSNRHFVMHDLIHDLAKYIAEDFCLMWEGDDINKISMRTRHFSCKVRINHVLLKDFVVSCRAKSLRTFLIKGFRSSLPISETLLHNLFLKFRFLRVLSLQGYHIIVLPDSIGQLIQLRYLDLSLTPIRSLPECLSTLYNLQTLKLSGCFRLTMLPRNMHDLVNLRYLDIEGTLIDEMPKQIYQLKSMQFCSNFVVSMEKGAGIGALGAFPDLRSTVSISKLHRIPTAKEASMARLKDKKHLNGINLSWTADITDVYDAQHERDILDELQPHKNLRSLSVQGYSNKRFSDWFGHHSYSSLASLGLHNCKNCHSLPPLGQLPSLKVLQIVCFDGLVKVGPEFYGDSSMRPFPCLEALLFLDMSSWEQWFLYQGDVFLCLRHLHLSNCPKLIGYLPSHLPAMEYLALEGCMQFVSCLPRTPAMHRLNIENCDNLSLRELTHSLRQLGIRGDHPLRLVFKIMTHTETFIEDLEISYCYAVISFPIASLPTSLRRLRIKSCKKLVLPIKECHKSLESLDIIDSCDSLGCFPMHFFPCLKSLSIEGCESLETLSDAQVVLHHIRRIMISNCHAFAYFPEGLMAPCLTNLSVQGCKKLKSLPHQLHRVFPSLRDLQIESCQAMESLPQISSPLNLSSLTIRNCEKLLERWRDWSLPSSLDSLYISGGFANVESFPEKGFLPASLKSLKLSRFSCLETLDSKGLQPLTSLQYLYILQCNRLKLISKATLPTSLIELEILECPLLGDQCRKKKAAVWPKIAHIPNIVVDHKIIS